MSFFNFDASSFKHSNKSNSNNNISNNSSSSNNNNNSNTLQPPSSPRPYRSGQDASPKRRSNNNNNTTSGGYLGNPIGMIGNILNRTTASSSSSNTTSTDHHNYSSQTRESNQSSIQKESAVYHNSNSSSTYMNYHNSHKNSPSPRGRHYYHNNGSITRTNQRVKGNQMTQQSQQQQSTSEKEMMSIETAAGAIPPLGVTAPTSFSFSPGMIRNDNEPNGRKRSQYLSFVSLQNPMIHQNSYSSDSSHINTNKGPFNYLKNERRLCVLDLDPFWAYLDANDNYHKNNCNDDTISHGGDNEEYRTQAYKDDDLHISIDSSNDIDRNIPILNPDIVFKHYVRFLLNNENTNYNHKTTVPSCISKSNDNYKSSKRNSKEKLSPPKYNIDSESESSLSFDERMRRERQRIHTGGVTQFTWGTFYNKNDHEISETNSNANTRRTPTTPKRRFKMNNSSVAPPTPEKIRTKNNYPATANTSQKSLRLLVPHRGNIYVQDGIGSALRLVYDKTTLEYPSKGSCRRRRRRRNDNLSGSAVAEDASAIDPQLSPDGSMVAFVVAGEIYVMNCDEVSDNGSTKTTTQRGNSQMDSEKNNGNMSSKSLRINSPIRITYGAINTDLNNHSSHNHNYFEGDYSDGEEEEFDSQDSMTEKSENRKRRYGQCVTHGLADFVAQEEMDRYRGFWWDTTSTGILFTKVDESHVAPYRITHQGKDIGFGGASDERDGAMSATVYEDHRYPFAGETNPEVILGYIPIHTNDVCNSRELSQPRNNVLSQEDARMSWVERKKWFPPPSEASEYLARVIWLPDGTACAQWQDRTQSTLILMNINVITGHTMKLHSEHSDVWINLHHMFKVLPRAIHPNECMPSTTSTGNNEISKNQNNSVLKPSTSCEERDGAEEPDPIMSLDQFPSVLPDGSFSFLFASERTGFCHLYLYTYVPGHSKATLIRAVSQGDWMVESIVGLDMDNDVVYITGTYTSPLEHHLYALPLINQHKHIFEETNTKAGIDSFGNKINDINPDYNKKLWNSDCDDKHVDESRVSRGLKQVINTLSGTVSPSVSSKPADLFRRRIHSDTNMHLSSLTQRYDPPLVASSQSIQPLRLTVEPGVHNVVMDESCRILVDTCSDLTRPPSTKVYTLPFDGPFSTKFDQPLKLIFVIYDATLDEDAIQNSRANKFYSYKNKSNGNTSYIKGYDDSNSKINYEYGYPAPELLSFSTSDGTETLHAALFSPDENIHGPGPYPLICSVYGGPHVQRVNRSWSQCVDMRAQRLCSLGFAVVKCDNRGSSRRGLAFESSIRKRLGRIEVLDQVAAVRHLVLMGVADPSRVGVYGWSYGGYLAAMCLCRAPDIFHVAIAGAPVTSWDGYDTHYTERYMGLPHDNRSGYNESAVFDHIPNMRGKLMIVHGLIDENVHFRHTARLINRLIAAGKDYDLLIFPDERHSPRKIRDRIYMEKRISDYFIKNLLGEHNINRNGATNYRTGNGFRRLAGHL